MNHNFHCNALCNFTAWIGIKRRWVEVRPLYMSHRKNEFVLTGEYIIYSNDKRSATGELQIETNQDNSILGSFFYSFATGKHYFKGKVSLTGDELAGIVQALISWANFPRIQLR